MDQREIADEVDSIDYCRLIEVPVHSERDGMLFAFESPAQVSFPIARVFMIREVPRGEARGFHANRELHELLVPARGSLLVTLRGRRRIQHFKLDTPGQSLYVAPMTWIEMTEFSHDAVLVVLASLPHSADDHITDLAEYLGSA